MSKTAESTPPASASATSERSGSQQEQDERGGSALRAFFVGLFTYYPTLVLLVILGGVFAITTDQFLTGENLTNLISAQGVVALVTFAAVIPLVAGEFDLSLGYMVGFVTMVGAFFAGQGWETAPLMAAVIAAGGAAGLLNAVLTVGFKISSFIATLGVGIILSGFTAAISGGEVLFEGIPQGISSFGSAEFLGINVTAWAAVGAVVVLVYGLEHTPFGRKFYATGGSERVAFLAGVRTQRIKVAAFVIGGLLVGLAGIVQLGVTGSASPTFGPELLLPAYAGAFLSVAAYRPGYFNIPGAAIAVVLIAVGFNGLSLMGVPFWAQPIFNGAVLLLAVLGARAESRRVKVG